MENHWQNSLNCFVKFVHLPRCFKDKSIIRIILDNSVISPCHVDFEKLGKEITDLPEAKNPPGIPEGFQCLF